MTPGKFLIVRDHDRYSSGLEILSTKDEKGEAIKFARQWAHSHPGKTVYILERHLLVASDALREEA